MSFFDSLKESIGAVPAPELVDEAVEETVASKETEESTDTVEVSKDTEEIAAALEAAEEEPAKNAPKEDEEKSKEEQPAEEPLTEDEADDISAIIIEDIKASQQKETEKPENPAPQPKEARNEMKDMKFYNKIAEKIYDFDRGLEMDPGLRDWIESAIKDDRILSVDFIDHVLPTILAKSPDLADRVISVAKSAEDKKYIPFKVFFVNNVDPDDTKEYVSFSDAVKTIQKEIDIYGVDPVKVFKAFYRKVDADGNIGEKVSTEVVEAYVDKFNGDKAALRKKLHLPKKEKSQPQSQPQNQSQKQPKNKGKKNSKADNGSKPANDNTSGAAT